MADYNDDAGRGCFVAFASILVGPPLVYVALDFWIAFTCKMWGFWCIEHQLVPWGFK